MKFTGDFHTHSIYSDGRNTIREMVDAACQKGLKKIAVTDHGPSNIGTGVRSADTYLMIKDEIKKLQANYSEIEIMWGAEANIISRAGDIDIPENLIKELDLLLVGLHPYVWPKGVGDGVSFLLTNQFAKIIKPWRETVRNLNTKVLVEALYNYPVDVVTHPGLGMPVDVEVVARACAKRETAFEINTGHNFQTVPEIKAAAKTGVNFIVNSDAHFSRSVGVLEPGLALLSHANVPPEQIINVKVENIVDNLFGTPDN